MVTTDRIATATDLDALCETLNAITEATDPTEQPDYGPYMTSRDLPTFGGEAPTRTEGIFSWDATRVLIPGEGRTWRIVPRAEA